MKITHDFTVSVPIERAWAVLTELEAIAPCMPGAQLTGADGGVYSGKVKVKVGPVVSEYAGTVRFAEKDDVNHHAVIDAKGRDSRGAGTAAAVISAQLTSEGDQTVVTVDTDLKISGRIAQFGSGMIKEVSQKLLGQFVERLEEKLATDLSMASAGAASPPSAEPEAVPGEAEQHRAAAEPEPTARRVVTPEPEPLDVMSVAGGSVYKRAIPVFVVLIVVVVVAVYLLVS
jgi:carbon monoxide dehydrogenase subunit G